MIFRSCRAAVEAAVKRASARGRSRWAAEAKNRHIYTSKPIAMKGEDISKKVRDISQIHAISQKNVAICIIETFYAIYEQKTLWRK